jgi:hypothetical protein
MGIHYLRSGERKWDLRSDVTIHKSIVFARSRSAEATSCIRHRRVLEAISLQ